VFRFVVSFLLVCLGAAVVRGVATGTFALTLIGLAGLLVVGAAAVSTFLPHEEPTTPAERRTQLRLVTSTPEGPRRSHGQDGGELRRAV
jgi:hypothetical protein